MSIKKWSPPVAIVAVAVALASFAFADPGASTAAPAGDPQIPPGWTEEEFKACMAAATPAKEHELLTRDAGEWQCKTYMWMDAESDPVESTGFSTVTPIMDGRFVRVEMECEMPGMGPFRGFGLYGFDNVTQEYVATWIDNMGTGMMSGVGEASDNGKKLTWEFTANCPLAKKPITIREVETVTGADTKTLEVYGPDRKSGEEFKMMRIELTRKS